MRFDSARSAKRRGIGLQANMKKTFSFAVAVLVGSSLLKAVTSFATSTTNLAEWTSWSPRDEIAPHFSIDSHRGRQGNNALEIQTRAASDYGAWKRRFDVS